MKKFITIILLIALCFPMFAEPGEQIILSNTTITENKRPFKSSTTTSAINLTLGFGIGSFIQGDWVGGLIGLAGDAVGASLTAYGLSKSLDIPFYVTTSGKIVCENAEDVTDVSKYLTITGVGIATLVTSRIISSTVIPGIYTSRQNSEIYKGLTLNVE